MALLRCFSKSKETEDTSSTNLTEVEDLYIRTVNPTHIVDFVWCIHNFSKFTESIYSKEFVMSDKCSPRWTCALISSSTKNKRYLDLELRRMDKDMPLKIHSEFKMLNRSGESIAMRTLDLVSFPFNDTFTVLYAPHPLELKTKKFYLPEDKLIIYGKLKVNGCCIITKAFAEQTDAVQSVEEKYQIVIHSSGDGSEVVDPCSVEEICVKSEKVDLNCCCSSFFNR